MSLEDSLDPNTKAKLIDESEKQFDDQYAFAEKKLSEDEAEEVRIFIENKKKYLNEINDMEKEIDNLIGSLDEKEGFMMMGEIMPKVYEMKDEIDSIRFTINSDLPKKYHEAIEKVRVNFGNLVKFVVEKKLN